MTLRWECEVSEVGIEVWVRVRGKGVRGGKKGGEETVRGDWIVGCEGANSGVRRSLFGSSFPGKTWDAQIVATNVSLGSQSKCVETRKADVIC